MGEPSSAVFEYMLVGLAVSGLIIALCVSDQFLFGSERWQLKNLLALSGIVAFCMAMVAFGYSRYVGGWFGETDRPIGNAIVTGASAWLVGFVGVFLIRGIKKFEART